VNLTHEDLNTSIDEWENWWTIQPVSYDTATLREKPSSNCQLSHRSWRFGIFDESHQYKGNNSVCWWIAMNARIGFKLQVSATLGFHSLYDWRSQAMWLFSGVPVDPQHETVIEKHGAEALYSVVKGLMHAIRTEVPNAKQDAAHRINKIAKLWTIRRCSELNLSNGKPPLPVLKENAHLVDPEWTDEEQAKLKTLLERYSSKGASGAWRVHRWQLACFSLELGETNDCNDCSGQWYDEWPLDT